MAKMPTKERVSGESAAGIDELRAVGEELDADEYPRVGTGGLVLPGACRADVNEPGQERDHVNHAEAGATRPEAGQGQRTTDRDTASEGAEARLLGLPGLSEELAHDLAGALAANPSMCVRVAPPLVWILTKIHPIAGLPDQALILTVLPISPGAAMEAGHPFASWAWWELGVWVGPRHTNPGNGSICSFEPSHGTWRRGDPILTLLDIHAVWIARQLHLRLLGRWPGDQVIHTAYERLRDQRPGEMCGCGSMRLYAECHEPFDRARTPYDLYIEFRQKWPNPIRRPPPSAWAEFSKFMRAPQFESAAA